MLRREHPSRFGSARDAKEFLVSKIVEEAQREGAPLSEVERKMLYFTENYWTLPDMASVSEAFDREYDRDQYEKRISQLVRKARVRTRKENPQELEDWKDAICILSKEDHYILVMLGEGGLSVPNPRGMPSVWRVLGTMVLLILLAVFGFDYLTRNMSKERAGSYYVLGAIWLVALYLILSLILGREKRDNLITKVTDKLFGFSGLK
jgi:hypothetical protein